MAAISAILGTFVPGTRTLAMNDVYGGTYRLFSKVLVPQGYTFEYADLSDLETVENALTRGPGVVWVETPTNPLLKIVDIAAIAERAHSVGAVVVVDNTFASPYLQQPLELGADIVVHSTTKYIGGHSDAVGGVAITSDDGARGGARVPAERGRLGARPGRLLPHPARRQDAVDPDARALRQRRPDRRLPGRRAEPSPTSSTRASTTHANHEVAARQMRDFGGMVSFRVRGGRAAADKALLETGIWSLGESLGGVESLVEHPGAMTHASLDGSGFEVPDDLIRLSVGIEHVDDLLADLERMLAAAVKG